MHNVEKYFAGIMPPVGPFPGTPAGTPRHPHVYMSGWVADYPGAGNFIDPQFGCGARGFANPSGWCSESLDAQVDEALLLYTTDPGAANRTWTKVEHQLVEQAAQAPVTTQSPRMPSRRAWRTCRSIPSGVCCSAASGCSTRWPQPSCRPNRAAVRSYDPAASP